MTTITEEDIEAIDEIAHEYISWCFQVEGRVPWLTDEERAAVEFALLIRDGERRYQAVLDVIETIVDNLAAEDWFKNPHR